MSANKFDRPIQAGCPWRWGRFGIVGSPGLTWTSYQDGTFRC